MQDKLENRRDELMELRKESNFLRTNLPEIISSIEKRQRALEARVDVLVSRGTSTTFQDSGIENVKHKLKALRGDMEHINYRVGCMCDVF